MSERTDAEMATYIREHRCYTADRSVTLADWDRGILAIERQARSVPSRPRGRAINDHERSCPDCQRVINEPVPTRPDEDVPIRLDPHGWAGVPFTRPDEPLTVERLAAALRACPSAVMVTWTHESAAAAILAALGTPSEAPDA